MPTLTSPPPGKRVTPREIIRVQDIIELYGCSQRSAYRTIENARKRAGQMNAPLTVDQFSIFSGISRSRIKEAMR